MIMDKAIAILQDLLGYEEEAEAKVEIHEAIAELQAHKAKIDELKEWATKTTKFALVSDDFSAGYSQGKTDILQKLEELEG